LIILIEVQGKDSSSNITPLGLEYDLSKNYNIPCEFKGLIFVRYYDHVLYNRTSALAMKPQVRETEGWLV
jgi:hypothetical protein